MIERNHAIGVEPASGNRYDRLEWAGAFGDLGTLIPFLVAYISLLKVDPFGIVFSFGVVMIAVGLYYRTPFPVQPMKAIGAVATTQAAQTILITPGAVYGASLVTGLLWLVLGATGAAKRVADWIGRPVATGIIMGLGFAFMLQGIKMISGDWLLGAIAFFGTMVLLTNRIIPVMFLLLVFGAGTALVQDPRLIDEFVQLRAEMRLPDFPLLRVTWEELLIGIVFLALPQVPLTLGNAIIAIKEENNRLFPLRPVNEKKVAISTGVINLFGAAAGGVPMCHGAGGMAGHVRFGARTGGAPVILGAILVFVALFFSGSVQTLFKIFPEPVLGVILLLTGAQLALGCEMAKEHAARFITLMVAAFAIWNVGVAFLVGIACDYLLRKGMLRL